MQLSKHRCLKQQCVFPCPILYCLFVAEHFNATSNSSLSKIYNFSYDHISTNQVIQISVPQNSFLGAVFFYYIYTLYVYDLNRSIKHSKTYHFADDKGILDFGKSPVLLTKKMSQDLKKFSQWLQPSKISLNDKKTTLINIHP